MQGQTELTLIPAQVYRIRYKLRNRFRAARPCLCRLTRDGNWGQSRSSPHFRVRLQIPGVSSVCPLIFPSFSGVRSTSEVYMHLVMANFYMLDLAGQKAPAGVNRDMGKKVTSKAEVIEWLKRSLEAVKKAHSTITAADLARRVHADGTGTTVGNVYLRMIVHNNEHMGQLVAYARMTGVVPPWSKN